MRKKLVNIYVIIAFALLLNIFFTSVSSPQIMGISPNLLSEFTSMSASEKQSLAKQYGIDIDELGLNGLAGANDQLGVPGSEVTSDANEILYERIIEAQDNKSKAEEYRRMKVPIFQKDYSSIEDLPTYGEFLFDGNYSTFAPTDNVLAPSDYIMGTGDSLTIFINGPNDTELNLTVNREGSIYFPDLGNLSISGMTFTEAVTYIKNRVSNEMIGVEIEISLGRLKSINIFMAGEAKIPGSYSVSALTSLSQAIYAAGGISDIGSLRDIQVKRSGELINSFDLYDLLTKGDSSGDIRLISGDVVFIPPSIRNIYIEGAVRREGKYELKENESIGKLISISGGLSDRAYLKKVYIERYSKSSDLPEIINLDLTNAENFKFKLNDGDIIRIAEVTQDLTRSLTMHGAVKRPGNYGWHEGLHFSDVISSVNSDFLNNFDMGKAIIIRRKNQSNFDIEVLDFDVSHAIENKYSDDDPILNIYDEIIVFSLGHNDDLLNELEVYNSDEDTSHPLYGKEDKRKENQDQQTSIPSNLQMPMYSSMMVTDPYNKSSQMGSGMTEEELEIYIYESKKEIEYNIRNSGKRRLLLKPVIAKLHQQASSSEIPKIVSISGAVKVPGEYPLVSGASYIDLVELAGGFSDDAYIDSAELRRTITDENGSMSINTSDINLSLFPDSKLKSRDHLHIRNIKDWDSRDSVILSGEVFYPGEYLISPNETLSSVIERAGGFTNESFTEGAVFTRESIKKKEREQLQILGDAIRRDQAARSMTKESEDFSVSSSELEASISALLSSAVYGRLIIDIPRLISGDISADIVLQDGDILSIPKYTNAVTVVGEVRRSGSFVRQDNFNIDNYIDLAAGMTARGDEKEIYIIRADGTVKKNKRKNTLLTFENANSDILAGDTIVVPIKSSYQTPLNLYSTVSQVVFQSIASIAAFSTVFN